MSDSFPTITDRLSDIEKEFMGCVEMHLDPPEDDDLRYKVDAIYRYAAGDWELPGNAVRFTVAVDETDPELTERLHLIDFLTLGDDGPPEFEGRVLHRMKRVEVVGRLVEQQHVATAAQELREVDPVALAARERADLALLVGAFEVEARDVGARAHLAVTDVDELLAA